jgi:aspartate aminotransferase
MPIAPHIKLALASSSMIRKMFEEGMQLKKKYGNDAVFDFSIGNPDIEPPPAFQDVLLKLARQNSKGSHGYMPNAGYPHVRQALAKKVSIEHNTELDFSHIVMSSGAAGGLNTVLKTICSVDDEIIVTKPYFMEYRAYASNYGAKLVEADTLEDFSLDLDAIEKAFSDKTRAVLINSPHNPTGQVYDSASISGLADLLKMHGKKTGNYPFLVMDEPYREIVYGNTQVPPVLCVYSESIVVSSYSKSLSLPGERIGYIAVAPDISDKDDVINGLIYSTRILGFVNAPALMQHIVSELTSEKVDVNVYARRRDAFREVLDSAGIKYLDPRGAFYLFCNVPERQKSISQETADEIHKQARDSDFTDHLKQHLILSVPGSSFAKPGWFRLAYCVDEKIIRASKTAFIKAMESW